MLHRDADDGNSVLAGRLAATLVTHAPGWRLPRPSEIARRHNVTVDEAHAAIKELVGRNLVRQAPDGYLYLAGPAEYRVSLESVTGIFAHVDPMGGELTCVSYRASLQAASTDVAYALRVAAGRQVGVLRLAWALNGAPAAMSTTYLADGVAEPDAIARWLAEGAERDSLPMPARGSGPSNRSTAVAVQTQLPSASAARRLRLSPGQMALVVTMLLYDGPGQQPVALTNSVLRPDLFRITLETPQAGLDGERLQAALALAGTDIAAAGLALADWRRPCLARADRA